MKIIKKAQGINKINPKNDKILAVIPNKVLGMFQKLDDITFDCWEMKGLTKGQELKYEMLYLFETSDLFSELDINYTIFSNFVTKIQQGYHQNPYHTCLHAFDVVQTTNFMIKKCNFQELADLSYVELASMYVAAACHDVDHPGHNNIYAINAQIDLALRYNGI